MARGGRPRPAAKTAVPSRGDVRAAAVVAMSVTTVGVAGLAAWIWFGGLLWGLLVVALLAGYVWLTRDDAQRMVADGATWKDVGNAFGLLVLALIFLVAPLLP